MTDRAPFIEGTGQGQRQRTTPHHTTCGQVTSDPRNGNEIVLTGCQGESVDADGPSTSFVLEEVKKRGRFRGVGLIGWLDKSVSQT